MSGDTLIRLALHEIYMGASVGMMRRLASIKIGGSNKTQSKDFGWHSDIESTCAEVACAKYLGRYWDGSINTFKEPDIAPDIQVRHTQIVKGCLVLRGDDNPREKFVLVTGENPEFIIRGYVVGSEGMKEEYERNPGNKYPAWFVPQDVLHSPAELLTSNMENGLI